MKVSLSWLKQYIPLELEVSRLADALTMTGFEVEAVSNRYEYLDTVLVGRVVEIRPHPNADTLIMCKVDVGNRMFSVICGAPNVKKNMLTATALPGTVFPGRSVLEENVIRGQASEGMLCSEAELGLGPDKSTIMDLSGDLSVGAPLAKALALSDTVLEISITPNRPDCLSIVGIAREVAAIQKTRITYPETVFADTGNAISRVTSVTIQAPDHCPRYAARLLEDVVVAPSPFWLQDRLMSVGLRPINNIVDITNFVMMETGQPLHAFDFDRLAGNRIVVRTAHDGEGFTTLDNKERRLSKDMLLICDGEKPVAIAGVMGGLNSEIEESTARILIESAYFSPTGIRKTSKQLGLNTEASYRFERGIDPEGTLKALNRAARLMAEIGGGRVIDGLIDAHPKPIPARTISLGAEDANRLLGTSLDLDEMGDLLNAVEFNVEKADQGHLLVVPPSFRVDVERPVDLMEEIARLSGYHHIPTTFPRISAEAKSTSSPLKLRDAIKRLMVGFGFAEAINYSFMNPSSGDRLGLKPDDPRRNMLRILNPLTEDQTVMRTSLIPGLLETMHRNLSQQIRNLRVFEVGKIFLGSGQDSLPEEMEMAVGLWTGARYDASWHCKESECDFYDIKGVVEGVLTGLGVNNQEFIQMPLDSCAYTNPGCTAQIFGENELIGLVGAVSAQTLHRFDLKQPAFIFELNLNRLSGLISARKHSKPLPKFPAVSRDITLIVDNRIESRNILACVQKTDQKLVEALHLFAVFEGNPIPAGKKSISFRITYRSSMETLEDETVNQIHTRITEQLLNTFDAALPV